MNRAADIAEKNSNRMSTAFAGLQSMALGIGSALGTAFSVGAFTNLIKSAIDAQDHLADLAKRSQLTVEQIGGIGFAASQAGSSLDEATVAMGKLNLTLAKASAGDKEATALFQSMGIAVQDATGKTRDAGTVLADVATKFATYADGPEKAALGNAIFGKSYQGIIPLLEDGGAKLKANIAYYERYSGVTAESARAADEFNDALTKLHLLQSNFGTTLANSLLPLLQALVDRLVDSKEKGDLFTVTANLIAGGLRFVAETAALAVGGIKILQINFDSIVQRAQAIGAAIGRQTDKATLLDPFGVKGRSANQAQLNKELFGINGQMDIEIAAARKSFQDFVREIQPKGAFVGPMPETVRGTARAPKVRGSGGGGGSSDAGKEVDNFIQKLTDETRALVFLGDTASATEIALLKMASDPKFASATAAQRAAILSLADGIDKLKDKRPPFDAWAGMTRDYNDAQEAAVKHTDALAEAFRALIDATPGERLEQVRGKLVMLRTELEANRISYVQYVEAARIAMESLPAAMERPLAEMDVFAQQAAKNIQDALGDTILSTFKGTTGGILNAWADMLQKMVAQALAASIAKSLFGDVLTGGKTGDSGFFGTAISAIGSWFSGIGKASGGPVNPYSVQTVNERGPELLQMAGGSQMLMMGSRGGKVIPNNMLGGGGANITFQIASGVSRNELAAMVPMMTATIKGELMATMRRPGFQRI